MPSWPVLLDEFNRQPSAEEKTGWTDSQLSGFLSRIAQRRNTNVVVYVSGFLHKPVVPTVLTSITREDINGMMAAISGLDFDKGLSLILHTPGGEMAATETLVDYLRSKFRYIETIVPVYAMSGGTMIALGSDLIVLGKQSQLGPIDAQMTLPNGTVSASSILGQFNRARNEISEDRNAAIVWAPILRTMGPSLLHQATNALELGQQMAASWLAMYMFQDFDDPEEKAAEVANYFNSEDVHLAHGRRIGVDECEEVGLRVERMEADQDFQDEILSVYHLLSIIFEQSAAVKIVRNQNGQSWVKNFQPGT